MTGLHFDMVQFVHILCKRQQFKDSTLQNDILGQSQKNTDLNKNLMCEQLQQQQKKRNIKSFLAIMILFLYS